MIPFKISKLPHLGTMATICAVLCVGLQSPSSAQIDRPDEAAAAPARDYVFVKLSIVPESREVAPFQPLYLKVTLTNSGSKECGIPEQIGSFGMRFQVTEEGFPTHTFVRGVRCFSRNATIPPNASVAGYFVVAVNQLRRDPRRSPTRIFDLPGNYEIRGLSGDVEPQAYTHVKSDPVPIRVRKPSEDETIAAQIIKGVKHGPPFNFTGVQDPELVKTLREFLAKYPESTFADDFKLLLGWRLLELAIKRTESERIINPKLQAEAIKIWMTVDVKRTWVRRTVITEELMTYLCKPEIQKHLNVRKVLTQWKNHPPHDVDDAEKAAILKEWVPKIETSLRENQGPKTL